MKDFIKNQAQHICIRHTGEEARTDTKGGKPPSNSQQKTNKRPAEKEKPEKHIAAPKLIP
jgi:hypothetical protein